jgi:hypothetical protein
MRRWIEECRAALADTQAAQEVRRFLFWGGEGGAGVMRRESGGRGSTVALWLRLSPPAACSRTPLIVILAIALSPLPPGCLQAVVHAQAAVKGRLRKLKEDEYDPDWHNLSWERCGGAVGVAAAVLWLAAATPDANVAWQLAVAARGSSCRHPPPTPGL